MKFNKISISLILTCFLSSTVFGEDIPEFGESYGGVVGIMDIDEIVSPALELLEAEPTLKFSLTPAYILADGSDIAGASIDLSKGSHGVQFRALNISPDGVNSIKQFRGSYKFALSSKDETFSYGISTRYVDTEDTNSTVEILGLVEKKFSGIANKTMIFSGNIKWSDRDFDDSSIPDADAIGGAIGLATVISSKLILSVDYVFEDDLNDDDTLSVTGIFPVKFGEKAFNIILGIDDNKTITLATKFNL